MKFTYLILVTASIACLANAASLSKRAGDQAKIINDCIEGIKRTSSSALTLTKDFDGMIKGKSDSTTQFEKSAKQAIADIQAFRPSCLKVSDTYNADQIAQLLAGFQPLLKSINTFYQDIMDHQKVASHHEKLVRELVKNINLSMGDFVAWKKKDGSTALAEKVDGSLSKTLDLIENINKAYGV
ncbi:hypothetical protein K501DRAFT_278143 [Backusella circina FSU 941]|nr:hypothetical protein K501DRAFT_278143 [Backusella circina FSU 941]